MAGKPLLIKLGLRTGRAAHTTLLHLVQPPLTYVGNRDGTFVITGGGVVSIVGQKGAAVVASITGGGVITITGRKGATVTMSVTGGGVISMVTAKGGQSAPQITGGGDIVIDFITNRTAVFNVTGGGGVTITADAPEDVGTIEVEFEIESGAGPVGQRQQDHLDDWTLAMDDEFLLETYLLRKTR